MRRGRWIVLLVAALAAVSLTGCTGRTCSGVYDPAVSVILDAAPWLHAHPGSTVRACLGTGPCQRTSGTWSIIILYTSGQPGARKSYDLTLTGTIEGATVLSMHTSQPIPVFVQKTACATITHQYEGLTLDPDETLSKTPGDVHP